MGCVALCSSLTFGLALPSPGLAENGAGARLQVPAAQLVPLHQAPSANEAVVVRLEHAGCEHVAKQVRLLFTQEENRQKVVYYTPINVILLRAPSHEIEQMKTMIARLDVEPPPVAPPAAPPPRQLMIIPVQHADAKSLCGLIQATVNGTTTSRSYAAKFAVDARTNVIVIHGTPLQIDQAEELVTRLDVPLDPPGLPVKE